LLFFYKHRSRYLVKQVVFGANSVESLQKITYNDVSHCVDCEWFTKNWDNSCRIAILFQKGECHYTKTYQNLVLLIWRTLTA